MSTPDENQFDDLLRGAFTGFRAQPDAYVWNGVRAAIRPQPPTLWQRLRPVGAGVLLGALLTGTGFYAAREKQPTTQSPAGTLLPATVATATPGVTTTPPLAEVAAATPVPNAEAAPVSGANTAKPIEARQMTRQPGWQQSVAAVTATRAVPGGTAVIALPRPDSVQPGARPEPVPSLATASIAGPWHAGLTLDTALRATLTRAYLPERLGEAGAAEGTARLDSATAHRARELLLAEAAVLQALTHRNDSLLRTLHEASPSAAAVEPTPPVQPAARWSVLLAQEVSGSWGTLPTTGAPTSEKLLYGQAQAASVERQFGDRWRVRLGVGQASVRSQLRYDFDSLGRRTHFDTAHIATVQLLSSVDTSVIVRQTSVMRLEPRLNNMGQVIGYDTTYIITRDTTRLIVRSYDTLRTHKTEVTRREETWREQGRQSLRPEYRFWTVPVAGQYTFWQRGPWRLGVSAGAQVLIFRGGTRPVWRSGAYRLERVGPRDGPFRPVSLAWQVSADAECRLGQRLSVAVSPGLRGWAIRPERAMKGAARPVPSLQVGLRWDF